MWRHCGQRQDERFVVTHHTSRRSGVMMWGAILYIARSPLVFITGTLTAECYINEVLPPVALPFLNAHSGALFEQDNARLHTAAISRACFEDTDTMPWPAASPDLSPITNVWDAIGCTTNTPPYHKNCTNCVRVFKLHGMDYRRTPLGTMTTPCRDVWCVVLADMAA